MHAGTSLLLVGRATCANESLRRSLRHGLTLAEFAETCVEAERLLPRCHFDSVVVDVATAADPALGWIEGVLQSPDSPRIWVAAPDDAAIRAACHRLGVETVLRLPLEAKVLIEACAQASAPSRAPGRASRPRAQLIGDSEPIRRVRVMVERVAPTTATVLIEGQTGTGKELVARLLHDRSGRRGPFVPVNCGAIPAELMESELFGHAKGAFTGAHQTREGLFVAARGGTLFLDEIGEMRSDLQVKLLRALEEGRIRPVGSDREVALDARIVASTQPGLREQVQEHRFREDLYYRLNVVHIRLPSLNERPEDIAALVTHFMQRVADEFGMPPGALDAAQQARLRARRWPGNVRELRNFVERTVLMGGPPDDEPESEPMETLAEPAAPGAYPLDWTLEQVKQAHILRVLAENRGNRSATARTLGLSRKTLERRLGPVPEHAVED
jgi:DNA-binding NtrC family response regulator